MRKSGEERRRKRKKKMTRKGKRTAYVPDDRKWVGGRAKAAASRIKNSRKLV